MRIKAVNIEIKIVKAAYLEYVSIFYWDQCWIQLSNWYLWHFSPTCCHRVVPETWFASNWDTSHPHRVHHFLNASSDVYRIFDHYCSMTILWLWHLRPHYCLLVFQIDLEILSTNLVVWNSNASQNVAIVSIWIAHNDARPIYLREVMGYIRDNLLLFCYRDLPSIDLHWLPLQPLLFLRLSKWCRKTSRL